MRAVFDELVETLPGDANQFFNQGMREMDRLDYLAPARELVKEYLDRVVKTRMH